MTCGSVQMFDGLGAEVDVSAGMGVKASVVEMAVGVNGARVAAGIEVGVAGTI